MYLSSVSSRLLLHGLDSWDLKRSYGCYEGIIRDISWSDDSKYLLQVNPKGHAEILIPADREMRSLQQVPVRDTWAASFHREGHRNVGIGTQSGNVLIWDTKNKTITKTFPTPSQQVPVNFISYNAKNTNIAASMQNGETIVYGLATNIPVLTVKLAYSQSISAMKFHHESRALLGLATDEGHVVLRDITNNKDKVFFENVHASPVSDFAYSLINKDVLLSCGFDKLMHVYDIRMQNVVTTVRTSYTLTSLAVNADNLVALGTKNGHILVYDLRDLTVPTKVLKGHEDEVHKVAFQPIRNKTMSTEISIRENIENISPAKQSPFRNKTSDVFMVTESPNRDQEMSEQNADTDSFLVMMGLDKTIDCSEISHRTTDLLMQSEKHELALNCLGSQKMSTPLLSRTGEHAPAEFDGEEQAPQPRPPRAERAADAAALQDFIKLSLADVADDGRNHFLHVMMALTKQKLFLEKQLGAVHEQLGALARGQEALVDANRRLALEIQILKAHKNTQ